MARSPFATQSFEPRFVVEHRSKEALVHGVKLWFLSASVEFGPPTTKVRRVTATASELYCHFPSRHSDAHVGGTLLEQPLNEEEASDYIWQWLQTATYSEQPWFDGGEAKGFCMFWNHSGSKEAEPAPRGALVVLPKWLEVHK